MMAAERVGSACTKLPSKVRRKLVLGAAALLLAAAGLANKGNNEVGVLLLATGGLILAVFACGLCSKRRQAKLCHAKLAQISVIISSARMLGARGTSQRWAPERGK